ncbi:hypothetical protein CEXT_455161 [Caerostris extrusa]|uniref:Uncharacterized protein n=1 Tax=Caerostris extrusa TaxID=172846 RepID=A0AAV4QEE4_CAEEX|nr:hypothetical protein CEXT_455161 [Caerostris extrusa]
MAGGQHPNQKSARPTTCWTDNDGAQPQALKSLSFTCRYFSNILGSKEKKRGYYTSVELFPGRHATLTQELDPLTTKCVSAITHPVKDVMAGGQHPNQKSARPTTCWTGNDGDQPQALKSLSFTCLYFSNILE